MSAVFSGICATPCGTQERCAPDSRMALAKDQVSGTHTKLPSRASKRPRPGNGKCTAYTRVSSSAARCRSSRQIGRASCGDSVRQYGWSRVGSVKLKKTKPEDNRCEEWI